MAAEPGRGWNWRRGFARLALAAWAAGMLALGGAALVLGDLDPRVRVHPAAAPEPRLVEPGLAARLLGRPAAAEPWEYEERPAYEAAQRRWREALRPAWRTGAFWRRAARWALAAAAWTALVAGGWALCVWVAHGFTRP